MKHAHFSRLVSFALIMTVTLLCCLTASAEEQKTEIIFRNIPWGSSVNETQKLLSADLGQSISLKKDEPAKVLDRSELGCYYSSYGLEYYKVTCDNLDLEGVPVDEIQMFFKEGKLIQAAYYFRQDLYKLKKISQSLDEQYGSHETAVSKQYKDVDLFTWEIDGRNIKAEAIWIKDYFLGNGYYSNFIIVYSDKK